MVIRFNNVSKKFGEVVALKNVSFEIKQGEFVFITGRSGAGKSTIIRLILAEILPTEGEVWLDDHCLNRAKTKEILALRRQIGVVFQDFRLLTNRTLKENILLALRVIGYRQSDWLEKLNRVLSLVGLKGREEFFPAQLSGGELQRACLARALIVEPKVILADEPTGNLDPETSWELMDLLKKINRQKTTVIMATHNFDIVNSLRQRVIKLEAGRLIFDKKRGKYE